MRRDALWLSPASPASVSSEACGSAIAGDSARVDAALLGRWRGAADGERKRICRASYLLNMQLDLIPTTKMTRQMNREKVEGKSAF